MKRDIIKKKLQYKKEQQFILLKCFLLNLLILQTLMSCTTSLIKNNVKKKERKIFDNKKPTIAEVLKKLGDPIKTYKASQKINNKSYLYKLLLYPTDYKDGDIFHCNHISYLFGAEEINKKKGNFKYIIKIMGQPHPAFTKDDYRLIAQKRCNGYVLKQIKIHNFWKGLAQVTQNHLKEEERAREREKNQPKKCYGNFSCDLEQKCIIKKYESVGFCADIYYYKE